MAVALAVTLAGCTATTANWATPDTTPVVTKTASPRPSVPQTSPKTEAPVSSEQPASAVPSVAVTPVGGQITSAPAGWVPYGAAKGSARATVYLPIEWYGVLLEAGLYEASLERAKNDATFLNFIKTTTASLRSTNTLFWAAYYGPGHSAPGGNQILTLYTEERINSDPKDFIASYGQLRAEPRERAAFVARIMQLPSREGYTVLRSWFNYLEADGSVKGRSSMYVIATNDLTKYYVLTAYAPRAVSDLRQPLFDQVASTLEIQ